MSGFFVEPPPPLSDESSPSPPATTRPPSPRALARRLLRGAPLADDPAFDPAVRWRAVAAQLAVLGRPDDLGRVHMSTETAALAALAGVIFGRLRHAHGGYPALLRALFAAFADVTRELAEERPLVPAERRGD